ncbi:MAG TPA: hypothetical protein ENH87_14290 [Pricia antarctica]|uniref:Uncharacterized protein n=1 Tax=Pricia antarctica TaxID=641691 RepID=A0A831QSW1_9FLAO|nr:hypothetical protein [Pricia antarctica]
MEEKQGPEKTEFVKEENESKEEYVFQKNTKTKTGTYIIVGILIILVIGILISALFFDAPGG